MNAQQKDHLRQLLLNLICAQDEVTHSHTLKNNSLTRELVKERDLIRKQIIKFVSEICAN
jgi:hypothetical protein